MANKYITEAEMAKADRSTLQQLRAQEQVTVMVLPDGGDPNLSVKINGTRWVIPKGVETAVTYDVYMYIKLKYAAALRSAKFAEENEMREIGAKAGSRRKKSDAPDSVDDE